MRWRRLHGRSRGGAGDLDGRSAPSWRGAGRPGRGDAAQIAGVAGLQQDQLAGVARTERPCPARRERPRPDGSGGGLALGGRSRLQERPACHRPVPGRPGAGVVAGKGCRLGPLGLLLAEAVHDPSGTVPAGQPEGDGPDLLQGVRLAARLRGRPRRTIRQRDPRGRRHPGASGWRPSWRAPQCRRSPASGRAPPLPRGRHRPPTGPSGTSRGSRVLPT